MAYDRYDPQNRWREGRFEERGFDRDRDRDRDWNRDRSSREERGWFERAGDEIASWFGGDEDDRRERERERSEHRGGFFGRDENEDRGRFWRDRSWDRGDFERDEQRSRSMGSRDRDFERDRGYRPMTGDYGRSRSEQFYAASGTPRGGFGRGEDERSSYGRSQSPYGRDEYRRTSFTGSSRERGRDFDPHYHSWRQRHVEDLDRDYDEYRREHQSKFEDDFSSWRERRMQKRGLLGQIREHMEVVGSDDQHVGTVDRVAGDRIILTKSDPESGGAHHSLSCTNIDRIEENKVILDCTADQARRNWRDEERGRALFERDDQGEAGPHILDRSFEGTYR